MLIILGLGAVLVVTVIAVIRSKKPVGLILEEAKYEILYQIEGSKAMWQDFVMKKHNKIGKLFNLNIFF